MGQLLAVRYTECDIVRCSDERVTPLVLLHKLSRQEKAMQEVLVPPWVIRMDTQAVVVPVV